MIKKSVFIGFLGNINFDTRVKNLHKSFTESGFSVSGAYYDWISKSDEKVTSGEKVIKLSKKYSSLYFYLKFLTTLLVKMVAAKPAIIFAEDIYTLPIAALIKRMYGAKLVYDSRELFGHLAALTGKNKLQNFFRKIEKLFIYSADIVVVTGEMDKEFLEKEYSISNIVVVRNLPLYKSELSTVNLHQKYDLSPDAKIVFYQGVVVAGRGIKFCIESLKHVQDAVLLIAGAGDKEQAFIDLAEELGVSSRVKYIGRINQEELLNYTSGADLGVSLIENVSLSYYMALPNKLFEYIMAGIPVAVSNLPQQVSVMNNYNVGAVIDIENKEVAIRELGELLHNESKLNQLKSNCKIAAKELNWENEIISLLTLLKQD